MADAEDPDSLRPWFKGDQSSTSNPARRRTAQGLHHGEAASRGLANWELASIVLVILVVALATAGALGL